MLGDLLNAINCAEWLQGLILDGIVAGVGAVLGSGLLSATSAVWPISCRCVSINSGCCFQVILESEASRHFC